MIETQNLTVTNGGFKLADVSFFVPHGQYCVLMGRTGSGKTTLLEAICGLKNVVAGKILLDGKDATHLKPAQRGVGLVPQDGALFQAMNVRDHLRFALTVRSWSEPAIKARVKEMASLLQIEKLLDRKPFQLSGGERQRVALGRALAYRPQILCLDEPLSALDDDTRRDMMKLLKRVQQEVDVTTLHITHNRSEAEQLADVRLEIRDQAVVTLGDTPASSGPASTQRSTSQSSIEHSRSQPISQPDVN